jgi:hypothetical protein
VYIYIINKYLCIFKNGVHIKYKVTNIYHNLTYHRKMRHIYLSRWLKRLPRTVIKWILCVMRSIDQVMLVLCSLCRCWHLFGGANHSKEPAAVLSGQARTVRDLARRGGALWSDADGPWHRVGRSATWCRSSGSLPDGRTVRALGPDGPRVRRGDGRSPAAPGSRSREGPRRGGEILGVV